MELAGCKDRQAFWTAAAVGLVEILAGDAAWYLRDVDFTRSRCALGSWSPDDLGRLSLRSLAGSHMPTHPIAMHFARTGDLSPVTVLDLVEGRVWRNSATYSGLRSHFGVTQQLALPVPTAHHGLGVFLVSRSRTNFGGQERTWAQRLQPLLVHLDDRLAELHDLRTLSGTVPIDFDTVPVDTDRRARHPAITPRELTVLSLLSQGLTAAAMARTLAVSVHTISKHQENLYRKLGTRDRLTTVLLARDLGLIAKPVRQHLTPPS